MTEYIANHNEPDAIEWEFVVPNAHGLHLRALQFLVNITNSYKSRADARNVSRNGEWINAKSIMGLLLLEAGKNTTVAVRIVGADAQAMLEDIQTLVSDNFNEVDKKPSKDDE